MTSTPPIREFDHLMCGAKDIEAVGETFEKLVFTVDPITPLEGIGVANRPILLTPQEPNIADYIECLQRGASTLEHCLICHAWAGSGPESRYAYVVHN